METLKQRPYLMILLGLLLAIKLIVVPIIDWQDEVYVRAALKYKQLSSAENALKHEQQLTAQLAVLKQQTSDVSSRIYPPEDESHFHLAIQQKIEALFTTHHLKVTNIGWLATKERTAWGLQLHQLQIRFEGDGVNFPILMAQLEADTKRIAIDEFNINFRRQTKTHIGDSMGAITLNFYMETEASKS